LWKREKVQALLRQRVGAPPVLERSGGVLAPRRVSRGLVRVPPQRRAQDAVARVRKAISEGKRRVIGPDRAAYFDSVRHDVLLGKVARRVRSA